MKVDGKARGKTPVTIAVGSSGLTKVELKGAGSVVLEFLRYAP